MNRWLIVVRICASLDFGLFSTDHVSATQKGSKERDYSAILAAKSHQEMIVYVEWQ